MRRQSGFTILELLISLSLSAFVILGMLQGYQNVNNFINRTRGIMVVNRKVCLLFNQLERDLMSCFIPVLNEHIEPTNPKKDNKQEQPEKREDKEENKQYFVSEIFPDKDEKINGKRRELLRFTSFITTNALRIYAQKRIMLVRVMYELVKDKEQSKKGKDVYQLLRRETTQLDNFEFKQDDSILQKDKKDDIKTVVVADNIKNLFVEYIADKTVEEQKKDTFSKDQAEKTRTFTWGDKKETKDVVPEMADIFITFWNDDLTREDSFEFLIPILSYPTEAKKEDEDKKKRQGKEDSKESKDVKPVVVKK